MRLAIVSPYITAAFGEEYLYNVQAFGLASNLAKIGVETDIITCRKKGDPMERVLDSTDGRVRVVYIGGNLRFPQVPLMNPLIIERLRTGKYDVVQVAEDYAPTSICITRMKQSIGARIVAFQGVYRIPCSATGMAYFSAYDKLLLPGTRNAIDCVIAKTNAAKSYMIGRGFKQVRTIPVGVNSTQFRPSNPRDARASLGIPEESIALLYVGKIIPGRRAELCIDALAAVNNVYHNTYLIIVGRGSELRKVMHKAQCNGVADKVIVLPNVRNKNLPGVYSAADITLLPMEPDTVFTFGMVIPESLSCGVPVVSMPVPAAIDHIQNGYNGYITDFSPKSFIDGILTILNSDAGRRTLSANARDYSRRHLDWSVLAVRYKKAYTDCR